MLESKNLQEEKAEERDSPSNLEESTVTRIRRSIPNIRRRKSSPQSEATNRNGLQIFTDMIYPRYKRDSYLPSPPPFSIDGTCHICNAILGRLKFKHNCRNCGKSVCGNHSTNNIPLPHFGIMKEVRVCDLCTKSIVQKRSKAFHEEQTADSSTLDEGFFGLIMNCLVEEQDNTIDSVLYFGTLRMGGKSLASRSLNANIAIWKERMFMLTHSEMMCFKPHEDSDLGEARKTVHLSDILHIEIDKQYHRVFTAILVDGRMFRLRTKTDEECQTIYSAVEKARRVFLDAMFLLQRGCRDEDNVVLLVTTKSRKTNTEVVIKRYPTNAEYFPLVLKQDGSVCIYLRGPTCWGVVDLSYEELKEKADSGEEFKAAALDPTAKIVSKNILYAHLRVVYQQRDDNELIPLGVGSILLVLGYRLMDKWLSLGLLVWSCSLFFIFLVYLPQIETLGSKSSCFSLSVLKCVMAEKVLTADEEFDIKDEDVDERFIQGCQGNLVEAKRRYKLTLQWRKNNDIDTLLTRPQPCFAAMKKVYPHYIHKRDKLGHPITIEFGGHLKKSMQDFLNEGVTKEEAIMHHVFIREYLWKEVDPRPYPNGMTLSILDIEGISIADVSSEVIAFMKKSGQAIGDNNPERMWKVFILNPPSWFNVIWKMVVPMINPKTRDKTQVIRGKKEIAKALLEHIDADSLPERYGGTCCCPGGCAENSPEEKALRELVQKLGNQEDNQTKKKSLG